MKLLLDTHVLLWLNDAPEKLSPLALTLCQDRANELYLSVVSIWEIQIKHQLGKLELDVSLAEIVRIQQTDNELKILSMELLHIYTLETLPFYHNDPFERLLIAQAIHEKMSLISADKQFIQYPVKVRW
jgi:PIN domain nuclease of toxin-antitoxin system